MTKPTIVTRAGKGDTLSWVEADANFTNLQNATIGVTDGTTSGTLDLNDTLTFTAGSNITLGYNASTKALTITGSAGGISDIVSDTTPQLGGNLDVNGYSIVSASNGNIGITPNGSGNIQLTPSTGKIILGATEWPSGTGTSGQVLTSGGGAGVLTWTTVSASPAGSNTEIQFNNSGSFGASSSLTFDGTNLKAPYLIATNSTGDEGGEMLLAKPATNSTIDGTGITIDVYQNKLRIFEQGGSARGVYIDITAAATGVGTNLLAGGGGATTLDGLSDVVLGTPATGKILQYNGTNWVDVEPSTLTVGVASTVAITIDNTTNATNFPLFVDALSGNEDVRTDLGFTYNPSTGVLTATSFSGAHNGTVGATTPSSGSFTTLTAQTTILDDVRETVYTGGATSGTITPDVANGTIQRITLTGNITFNAFANPVAGQSLTLIINTNATGRTLTSTMKFAGGFKTLSITASTDILSVFYDGTNYYASLVKGYA